MVNEQPEALRLADALENGTYLLSVERNATAAELRRLHAAHEHQYNMAGLMLRGAERAERQRDALLHALVTAMPFVEDADDDEVYKSHRFWEARA